MDLLLELRCPVVTMLLKALPLEVQISPKLKALTSISVIRVTSVIKLTMQPLVPRNAQSVSSCLLKVLHLPLTVYLAMEVTPVVLLKELLIP
jgi:hypothetical protein